MNQQGLLFFIFLILLHVPYKSTLYLSFVLIQVYLEIRISYCNNRTESLSLQCENQWFLSIKRKTNLSIIKKILSQLFRSNDNWLNSDKCILSISFFYYHFIMLIKFIGSVDEYFFFYDSKMIIMENLIIYLHSYFDWWIKMILDPFNIITDLKIKIYLAIKTFSLTRTNKKC